MRRRAIPFGAIALTMVLVSADAARPPGETGSVAQPRAAAQGTPIHPAPEPVAATSSPSPAPVPAPEQAPAPAPRPVTLAAGPVSVKADGFLAWALLDRVGGGIAGSSNLAATNTTESVIKIWLVADFLRRSAESRRKPPAIRLQQASRAIRDSDDNATESLYRAGGGDAVVDRMISRCRLTETRRSPGSWSKTTFSARDAARLGDCVADGTAAGPQWTKWVLDEMTKVRGTTAAADQPNGGRWGIIDGLPEELRKPGVRLKNGWTLRADGQWHVNCLAVADQWSLAVLTRYPGGKGLTHGAKICADVTRQLVSDPA